MKLVQSLQEITYPNGFKQTKAIISNSDYDLILKPLEKAIGQLEDINHIGYRELKKAKEGLFGRYDIVRHDSPLGRSVKTGILTIYDGIRTVNVNWVKK